MFSGFYAPRTVCLSFGCPYRQWREERLGTVIISHRSSTAAPRVASFCRWVSVSVIALRLLLWFGP